MITLLATAAATATAAAETTDALEGGNFGTQALNFILSTIFSIIVLWLVIKIWKGEIWKGDGKGK